MRRANRLILVPLALTVAAGCCGLAPMLHVGRACAGLAWAAGLLFAAAILGTVLNLRFFAREMTLRARVRRNHRAARSARQLADRASVRVRELQIALELARAERAALEGEIGRLKNEFTSMVSHELRTPLASIKAYVEMLIDGEATDAQTQREFYDVIQNEANRLGRLIDNVLNISRIEAGLVRVHREALDVADVLRDAIDTIAPHASAKRISLDADLPDTPYETSADRDMLYQAAVNLMSNAIKYTPEGGAVRVEAEADEARKKLVVRIIDTGVGIPPKDLPHVFDKFYRAEANNVIAPGTGLGLSLVRHIIQTVHRGRVWAESRLGKGSTFAFELDLIPSDSLLCC